jgi:hypothetical protein
MENNVVEQNKKKNLIIGVLVCIIVVLTVVLVYLLFLKKDKLEEPIKPQDNQQVENIDKDIAMLNDGLRNLLFEELTLDEFKEQAKQYCTDDLITKLSEYYISDISMICINAGGCSVNGGYIGEVTDINYRDFRIVSKNATIIEGIGVYGESKENVQEQKIRYKFDNGTWKIDDFDITRY